MRSYDVFRLEPTVANIIYTLGHVHDWRDVPCVPQLLAFGLRAAEVADADYADFMEELEDNAEENPVTGITAFAEYARQYIGWVHEFGTPGETARPRSKSERDADVELTEPV